MVLPVLLEVQAIAAIKGYGAGREGRGVVEAAIVASRQLDIDRHEGCTDEVVGAFSLGFPVIGAEVVAGRKVESARSEGVGCGGDGVGVGGAVVGDVQGTAAAIVDIVADHPVVGLAAIDEVPAVDAVELEVEKQREW